MAAVAGQQQQNAAAGNGNANDGNGSIRYIQQGRLMRNNDIGIVQHVTEILWEAVNQIGFLYVITVNKNTINK